jgi:translation initiation factor 1
MRPFYLRFMGKSGDGMRRLKGLDALADLHRAMGGEKAEIPEEQASGPSAEIPAVLYVSRDRKARKGKEVTLVEGFDPDVHEQLARDVAKALKSHCGVGGGWKEGAVLLQGDHRQRVADWLTRSGYRVKHKGG